MCTLLRLVLLAILKLVSLLVIGYAAHYECTPECDSFTGSALLAASFVTWIWTSLVLTAYLWVYLDKARWEEQEARIEMAGFLLLLAAWSVIVAASGGWTRQTYPKMIDGDDRGDKNHKPPAARIPDLEKTETRLAELVAVLVALNCAVLIGQNLHGVSVSDNRSRWTAVTANLPHI